MVATPKLDRIDINILAQLQNNCRISNVELAEAVGLSPSPCLSRVKRLEKAGFIISFNAKLNLSKLVEHITVFTEVTLNGHRQNDFVKFEAEIRKYDALQECHLVSGGYDYLLKFLAPNVAKYQEMMEGILDRNIGMEKYFSYIVIKTIIQRDNIPLKYLIDE
ncbi:MAG: winged helix-turn-helix transcriptional regulator [Pseudochelatococcus sp.]|jgi:DNA-binding Lrp family transcriptional regulator|uniref:winged helix-turn-helix transcriptional regulator n=1 Tax=Pseudochelatococcus sp. TaxID=2020869 RepID=UPI003D9018C6